MAGLSDAVLLLQAHNYSGSGDWLDESGNSHDATPSGATFLANTGTQYLWLPGAASNYASTPDANPLDITGDLELEFWGEPADYTPVAPFEALISKYQTSGNQRSYYLVLRSSGTLSFFWSTNGTDSIEEQSTAAVPVGDLYFKVTLDVNNGSGAYEVKFYTGGSGSSPSWSQLGTTKTGGSTTSVNSGSAPLHIGARGDGTSHPYSGKVHRAIVRNGINGTAVFDADFTDTTAVTEPFATFTEASSNAATVTINRASSGYVSTVVDRAMWILDGSNDSLTISNHADLNFGSTDDLTLMIVVRASSAAVSYPALVAKRNNFVGATGAGYHLHMDIAAPDRPTFQISDGTNAPVAADYGAPWDQIPSETLTVVTGVRDAQTTVEGFLDGSSWDSSTDTTTGSLTNTHALTIGARSGGGNYLNGQIIALVLWDQALSDSDVAAAGAALIGSGVAFNNDVTLLIQIGWDASGPLDTSFTWTDVTEHCRAFSTKTGRGHEFDTVQAGVASFLFDNADRRFEPEYASGAYYPNVRPMRPIRVQAEYNKTTYDVWYGYIESFPQEWPTQKDAITRVSAVDGFKVLAFWEVTDSEVQELSGTRIGNLLDSAGWPAGWRALDTGAYQVQAFTPDCAAVLGEIDRVVRTEDGLFFMAPDGNATFHDSNHRGGAAVATFNDTTGNRYVDLQLGYDDHNIWNDVTVAAVGTTPQAADDATSVTEFGRRKLKRFDTLHISAANALTVAQGLRDRYKNPGMRVQAITVNPLRDATNLWPQVLTRGISDKITVARTPPGGGAAISADVYIEGVDHTVDAQTRTWSTTWVLSPA